MNRGDGEMRMSGIDSHFAVKIDFHVNHRAEPAQNGMAVCSRPRSIETAAGEGCSGLLKGEEPGAASASAKKDLDV
jgi:hypothetical protein